MMFWILSAFLTLAATLALLVPLTRSRPGMASGAAHYDVEVYRDQLRELEGDAERGLIDEVSATEARGEIGRRLLKAAKAAGTAGGGTLSHRGAGRWLMFAAVISVPLVSWGLYSKVGSPELPAEPLAARLSKNPSQSTVEELLARAERHLAADPGDGRGWDVLAPVYLRVGEFDKSATAFRNAIRILGPTAARQTGLGEALTAMANGTVSPEAKDAFEQAAAMDPSAVEPRFFIASELAQQGNLDEAESQFKALKVSAATDGRWTEQIDAALSEIGRRRNGETEPAAPGPTAADVAAASGMSADQRASMIDGMVAKLDERLKANPGDVEGWKRLVRSYAVLGRQADAQAAAIRGSAAIASAAGDAAKADFEEFVAGLGVTAGSAGAPSGGTPAAPAPGPTAADVDAASKMSADQRTAMIDGMVAKLDERLKSNPGDVEGWKRLVRSYAVLGRQTDASDAAARGSAAIAAVAGDGARIEFEQFVSSLGVTMGRQKQ